MGEGEFVKTDKPFHIMNAVLRTKAKLRSWPARPRVEPRPETILAVLLCCCVSGSFGGEAIQMVKSVVGDEVAITCRK